MSGDRPRIDVEGVVEFQRAVKQLDADAGKRMRLVQNDAANIVIDYARPRIPTKSGRARASLKASSSQRESRVSLGGNRAPHTPWLDFGGEGPGGRPARRPFITRGRYLFPALDVKRDEFVETMTAGMVALARDVGWEVE